MAAGRPGTDPAAERPLAVLLARATTLHRQALGQRLRHEQWCIDAGFRPPCIGALTTIAACQPLSQRELSAQLAVDPSDIVGVIDILEGAGFVSRQRDPEDRRRQALTLTPAGRAAVRRLHEVLDEVEQEVFGSVAPEDRQTLRRILEGVAGGPP